MPKNAENFICKTCDFVCCKKSNWVAHTSTQKHKRLILANYGKQEKCHSILNQCLCGKIYKHTSSLCKHKKSCSFINDDTIPDEEQNNTHDKGLIYKLLQQNNDLQNKIVEICKNNSNIVNNNNIITTNSHNKTFNMNVFLNEHCKDAMNISEFVDSIKLGYADLVNVGKVGYVEGISGIIIKKLNELDIYKRPMHCGDEKRHSMYIKEDGKWEKQPDDNNRIRRLIKQVAFKNTKNTVLFKEKYPDCGTGDSKYSDQYNKIVMESFGGRGATDEEKENKIVRMIAKAVYIDKNI
jgi:hypothetical protein